MKKLIAWLRVNWSAHPYISNLLFILALFGAIQGINQCFNPSATKSDIMALRKELSEKLERRSSDSLPEENPYPSATFESIERSLGLGYKQIGDDIWHKVREGTLALDSTRDFSTAKNIFSSLSSVFPKNSQLWYNLGLSCVGLHDYVGSERAFRKAVEADSLNVYALSNLGMSLARLESYNAAIAQYDRALSIDSGLTLTLVNKGTALAHLREFNAAIESNRRAISVDSTFGMAYFNLGHSYRQLEVIDSAYYYYHVALRFEPLDPAVHNNLGYVFEYYTDSFDSALLYYSKAISLDPHHVTSMNNKGNVYRMLNKVDSSEFYFRLAIRTDSLFAAPYINYARLLFDQDRFHEATPLLNKFLEVASKNDADREEAEIRLRAISAHVD